MTVRSAVKKPVLRKCIGCMDLKEKNKAIEMIETELKKE